MDALQEKLNHLDEGLNWTANQLNEPDEIIMLNLPSFRADMKSACKLIREIQTIKAALDASGWMPVESAPRDGTEVYLWDRNLKSARVGRFSTHTGKFTPPVNPIYWQPINPPKNGV